MEFSTYSLNDFLPFGREAFLLLLANYHVEFWPINAALMALSVVGLAITFWRGHYAAWLLTVPWLWIGFMYYRVWYGQLNWASDYFAGACVLQACLLALSIRDSGDLREWNAVTPVLILVFVPLGNYLFMERWWIESVGFTPLATSLFFLGWLSIVRPFRWWLAIIPGLIVVVELATYTMI